VTFGDRGLLSKRLFPVAYAAASADNLLHPTRRARPDAATDP